VEQVITPEEVVVILGCQDLLVRQIVIAGGNRARFDAGDVGHMDIDGVVVFVEFTLERGVCVDSDADVSRGANGHPMDGKTCSSAADIAGELLQGMRPDGRICGGLVNRPDKMESGLGWVHRRRLLA